jgi:hypothetical protein
LLIDDLIIVLVFNDPDLTCSHEETMTGQRIKVDLVVYRTIILALWLVESDSHPDAMRERRLSYEQDLASPICGQFTPLVEPERRIALGRRHDMREVVMPEREKRGKAKGKQETSFKVSLFDALQQQRPQVKLLTSLREPHLPIFTAVFKLKETCDFYHHQSNPTLL